MVRLNRMRALSIGVIALTLLLLSGVTWLDQTTGTPAHPSFAGTVTTSLAALPTSVGTVGTYPVTFTESGLPPGTNWSVSLNETTGSSVSPTITLAEPNGSYPVYTWDVKGYTSFTNVTTVNVSGAPDQVTVYYFSPRYPGYYFVNFVQSGLPFNVYWTVAFGAIVNGTTEWSMYQNWFGPTHDPTGVYGVTNGTFAWKASVSNLTYWPCSCYSPIPSIGQVVVNGSSIVVHLTFRYSYNFVFIFTGLSTSTTWTLQLLNETFTGSGGVNVNFIVEIPNGTYGWNASAPGYRAQNGTVTVVGGQGSNVQEIQLQALPQTSAFPSWAWGALGVVVVAVVLGLLLLIRRRRRDAAPLPPPPPIV